MSENYYAMTRLLDRKQFEASAEVEQDHLSASVEQAPPSRRSRAQKLEQLLLRGLATTSFIHRRRLARG
ncbi:MAG TPA: hypothetical protein VKU87_10595 [Thermomicrobiaceae bacterium]|nr:hypothetical protein [Thermomicrobiaceae bacterium]